MRITDLAVFLSLFAIQVLSQDLQYFPGLARKSFPVRQLPPLLARQANTCPAGTKQCSASVPVCVLTTDVCCTGSATSVGGSCPVGYYCVDTESSNPGCCEDGTISCGPTGTTCCPNGLQCVSIGSTFICQAGSPTIATTVGQQPSTASSLTTPSSVSTTPTLNSMIPSTTTAFVTVTPSSTSDPSPTPIPSKSNNGALIGGLVGGLGGATLILSALLFWWYRRKRSAPDTFQPKYELSPISPGEDPKRFAPATPPPVQSDRHVPYWMATTPEEQSQLYSLRYPDDHHYR